MVVLVFALGTGTARIVCLVLFVVASATYIVEYGLVEAYGEVLIRWPHPGWLNGWSVWFGLPTMDTIFRLPIFAAYLAFLALAVVTVTRQAFGRPAAPLSV